ncbi:unnamed protein product, partial [marine sediment metagenome]
DGGFVVTWESNFQEAPGYGIYAQRYNSTGGIVDNEFHVNSYTTDDQSFPSVTGLSNGGFVVVWVEEDGQDGNTRGIYAIERVPGAAARPRHHKATIRQADY